MQTNGFAGLVQKGPRRPQAITGTHVTPGTRAHGVGVDESRRRDVRQQPRKPHRYGAGF